LDSIEVFVFLRQPQNFNCVHILNYARAENSTNWPTSDALPRSRLNP
jgi:hypothetical protein